MQALECQKRQHRQAAAGAISPGLPCPLLVLHAVKKQLLQNRLLLVCNFHCLLHHCNIRSSNPQSGLCVVRSHPVPPISSHAHSLSPVTLAYQEPSPGLVALFWVRGWEPHHWEARSSRTTQAFYLDQQDFACGAALSLSFLDAPSLIPAGLQIAALAASKDHNKFFVNFVRAVGGFPSVAEEIINGKCLKLKLPQKASFSIIGF